MRNECLPIRLKVRLSITLLGSAAVIGMLPVVGGAMLSAPLVSAASDELKLGPERRRFLNYWFRHVWEYSPPTFPAVFLDRRNRRHPPRVGRLARTHLSLELAGLAGFMIAAMKSARAPNTVPLPIYHAQKRGWILPIG